MKAQHFLFLLNSLVLLASCNDESAVPIAEFTRRDDVPEAQFASLGNSETNDSYVLFRDPNEGAFSVEVPKGWKVQGGLVRKTASFFNPWVRVTSPDGSKTIFFGDPNRVFYKVPDQYARMMGAREGSSIQGMEGMGVYSSYLSGEQFAQSYARNAFGSRGSFQILRSGRESSMVREVQAEYAAYRNQLAGANVRTNGGQIEFRFGRGQQGCLVAVTTLLQGYGGSMWQLDRLGGFSAPERQIEETRSIFNHMLQSFKVNPRWQQQQQGRDSQTMQASTQYALQAQRQRGNAYANISKTLSETNDIITNGWNNNQARIDNSMQNYSNGYRGTEDVYNSNGQGYNVWDTNKYYWQGRDGSVIGTDQYQNPDPSNYSPMRRRGN